MGYKISWLVDQRIIFLYQYGITNIEELQQVIEDQMAMQTEGISPVHVINDSTHIEKMLFGLADIKKVLNLPHVKGNAGWYVLVSPDRFKRFLANIAGEFSGGRHREFATIQEAIDFLHSMDDSLGEIPLPDYEYED